MEFPQVLGWNGRWRVLEERPRRSGFWKCNHVAKRRRARQHHRYSVKAERYSAVGRSTGAESIEQKSETSLCVRCIDTEERQHAALQRRIVDADAAAAELGTVQHDVVRKCAHFFRRRIKEREILRIR